MKISVIYVLIIAAINCLCTNYGVYQECLLKWIETSKKSNCSVYKYE